MEALLLLISFVILIVLITSNSSMRNELRAMHQRISELTDQLRLLKKNDVSSDDTIGEKTTEVKTEANIPAPRAQVPPVILPPAEVERIPAAVQPEPVPANVPPIPVMAPKPVKPKKPGFFERNPDLEKFIGENLANKIGIAILVIGIGFFVKYAIDQDWINEIGRVFIGILCGGILLGIAHWLRHRFAAFSSVLVGGGIAVLYLTIAIAFHEYAIFSQTTAFIIMVFITGFAIVFSLAYNRVELAVLAILGGFASPFMVSTGEGNYVVLFIYILILDTGMLVLSYYKKWNLVYLVSFVFTVILFGSWMSVQFDENKPGMTGGALAFATLFYLEFFAMNIINNLKERVPFKGIEFAMLLSNTFLYYSAGMFVLSFPGGYVYRGLFTIGLAVFNFVFTFLLFKNARVDRRLIFLLIGLVLTFVSLAAPVQLEGNYITLFWAAEALLLLWLSHKSGIRLMTIGSVIVTALMVFSLVMDWWQIYNGFEETKRMLFLNKGWITTMFVVVSMFMTIRLWREEDKVVVSAATYRTILTVAAVIILYIGNLLEVDYQAGFAFDAWTSVEIVKGCYNMFFVLMLLVFQKRIVNTTAATNLFPFWGVVAVLAYLAFYHGVIRDARYDYLVGNGEATGFMLHYVLVVLLLASCAWSIAGFRAQPEFGKRTYHAYSWFYMTFFIVLASAELDHAVLMTTYSPDADMYHLLEQNQKIGYPILWGLSSFVLISVGLKWKIRHLRVISLTLFLITLLKLFIIDIRGISEGGKIAAFISLGVLLLIVSFMYQRLKKLLLTDDRDQSNQS